MNYFLGFTDNLLCAFENLDKEEAIVYFDL